MAREVRSFPKDLTLDEFRRFRDYIHQHSGIYLEDGKLDSLRISLLTRATRLEVVSLDEYFDILISSDVELNEMLNLVTINETSFFRFPAQFDALRDHVLPEILDAKVAGDRQLRIWSAGCSTGEEPYSLAIALIDAGVSSLGWQPSVVGTDVSTKALGVAKTGVYRRKPGLNLPEDVIRRHFDAEGDRVRVLPHVRRMVSFQYHNLIKEPYPLEMMSCWDVIFCRNVTIYFQLESTRRVVSTFYRSLNEGGYLFIGHSETLTTINDEFEPVEVGGVFLYRKARRSHVHAVAPIILPPTSAVPRRPSADEKPAPRAARDTRTRQPARASAAAVPADAPSEAAESVEALLAHAGELLVEEGPGAVLELAGRVLAMEPDNAAAHMLAAHAAADLGDYDAATASARRALAIDPLLPVAHYVLGLIHQRQADIDSAISEFKKTIYVAPDFALAHLNLGTIYKSKHDWQGAAREYENAMRSLKKSPEGAWTQFLGGFEPELLAKTCERSLIECRKALGIA